MWSLRERTCRCNNQALILSGLNSRMSLYQLFDVNMTCSSDEHYELSTQEQTHFLSSGYSPAPKEYNMRSLQRCLIHFLRSPRSLHPSLVKNFLSNLIFEYGLYKVVHGHMGLNGKTPWSYLETSFFGCAFYFLLLLAMTYFSTSTLYFAKMTWIWYLALQMAQCSLR